MSNPPGYPKSEPRTGPVDGGQRAQLAGSILDNFDQLETDFDRTRLAELVGIFSAAGDLRGVVLAVARAVLEAR
ncbi:MAG: hypothetical protein ACOY0T_37830 [Myxococcota bacterium]